MKESRKEFIKKAHSAACNEWKENIEKEFPKLFKEDDLKVGKWYTDGLNQGFLVCITKSNTNTYFGFGFNGSGTWVYDDGEYWGYTYDIKRPATDKEVKEALIKEAEKRGFKEGVAFKSVSSRNSMNRVCDGFRYYSSQDQLCSGRGSVFIKGEWATIIETITKEQAEKELGKTILN